MSVSKTLDVNEVFDDLPFSAYQIGICVLCFIVVFFDGFDLTVIGVAIPGMMKHLGVSPAEIGAAVSAGQLGPMVGAVALGMVADKYGRKKTMFASALVFGFFTYMTVHISSCTELGVYRFLAGLGMGGVIPNALAFGSEYAPSRLRAGLSLYMWAGMPTGAMIAAFAASYLLPHWGWQSVFYVGGLAPVGIAFLVLIILPESISHLVKSGKPEEAKRIVRKIDKSSTLDLSMDLRVQHQGKEKSGGMKSLFSGDFAKTTSLLWLLFFLSFFLLWILFSWVPTLLKQAGATTEQFSIGFAFIHMGSVIACLCIGTLMSKFNKLNVVKYLFLGAFVAMIAFGYFATHAFTIILLVSIFTGMLVNGGNSSLMGLASAVYPSEMRGSGIGCAYGIGKIGTLIAPLVGGLYLEYGWSVLKICAVNSVSALIIFAIVMILQKHMRASAGGEV